MTPNQPGWPWRQKSILITNAEEERHNANYWLDYEYGESESDSDYILSDNSSTESEITEDSLSGSSQEESNGIDDTEVRDLVQDAATGWPSSPTPSERRRAEDKTLESEVASLVEAEEKSTSTYNPDDVVALLTEFYELMVSMGHWPPG